MIHRWLAVPDNQREIAALGDGGDPEVYCSGVRDQTREHIANLTRLSDLTFASFAGLFGPVRRSDPHPHAR